MCGLERSANRYQVQRFGWWTWPEKVHAKIALARLGHPRAMAEIMADLDSKRPDLLGAAVVSAGRARLARARALIERIPTVAVDPELVREALARLDRATEDAASHDPAPNDATEDPDEGDAS